MQLDTLVTSLDSINQMAEALNQLASTTCSQISFSTTTPKKTNNVKNSLQKNMKAELKEEKTKVEDVCKDFLMNFLNPPKEKSDCEPTEEHKLRENLQRFIKKQSGQ